MASADKGLDDVPEGEWTRGPPGTHCEISTEDTAELAFAGQIESNYDETVDSFDAMELKSDLLRGKYRVPETP